MGSMRNWGLWVTSAVAVIASGIALWSLFGAALPPGALLAGAGAILVFGLAAAGFWRAGRASGLAEKTAHDLDIVARRLLRLEARLAEIERHPHAETRKTVAEVSGEIALLSGLLRDLAGSVSGHDRDVATLAEEIVGLRERLDGAAHGPAPAASRPATDAPAGWADRLSDLGPPEADTTAAAPALRETDPPATTTPPPPALAPEAPAANDRDALIGGISAVEDALFSAPPEPAEPAPDPAEEARKRAIIQAFREDRLEIHLQPVVSLPQRKTRFYEALARLRLDEQTLLEPDEFLPALAESQLLPELDGKVAARAAAVARHLVNRGSEGFVSCNLAAVSVRTPGFLRALGRILEAYPDILGRLAFEIPQRAWRMLDAEAAGALEQLRGKGAFFILDRATDMRLDPLSLADRGVAYAKLPARMLLDPQPSHGLDFEPADLATVLNRAGIRLVAEKVEAESDVPDLIDIDIPLAQGYVFAPPRAVRPDIVAGLARRATPPASTPDASARSGRPQADKSRTDTSRANKPVADTRVAGGGPARSKPAAGEAATSSTDQPPDPPEPRLPYRAFLRRAG